MAYTKLIAGIATLTLTCACENAAPYTNEQLDSISVITPDQVSYQPLNPARGDASPKAGVLWGDIREDIPSGVLLQFAEGFASPPHIHNITYRAIVINGEVHNDDPGAANMWMGPGTFWTQPAGEVHITSAKPGLGATAFLEILEGPYLVQPGDQAFDNGEQPLNLAKSNLVWMGPDDFEWITSDPTSESSPSAALLWGDLSQGSLSASLVKVPSESKFSIKTQGGDLKAVIVQGKLTHSVAGVADITNIGAGGFFGSKAGIYHALNCTSTEECLIYVRTQGRFTVE